MTGDELAAALYAEQGYLVLSYYQEQEIGSIHKRFTHGGIEVVPIPIRLISKSSIMEFDRQQDTKARMGARRDKPLGHHFYRVEAAD